jgi:hypothetical protein
VRRTLYRLWLFIRKLRAPAAADMWGKYAEIMA